MSKMQKLIKFRVEGKALSVNEAYVNGRGNQRAKSSAYNSFEYEMCDQLFTKNVLPELGIVGMQPIFIFYRFYYPIYKKGTTHLSKTAGDVSNLIKPLEDIMAYYFGFNDSQVLGFFSGKQHSEERYFEVEIFRVDD